MTPSEIYKDIVRNLTDNAFSYATVNRWLNEFKCSRKRMENDPSSERPQIATTKDNLDFARCMIKQNRWISSCQLAERLDISTERLDNILTKVPKGFPKEQKRNRCTLSTKTLELFEAGEKKFHIRLITMDGSWFHHYKPKTKENQCKHTSSLTPKKGRFIPLAGKVFASAFSMILKAPCWSITLKRVTMREDYITPGYGNASEKAGNVRQRIPFSSRQCSSPHLSHCHGNIL